MNIQEITEKVYSNDPFICTYDNLLTDEECNHFINLSKGNLQKALVSENKTGIVSNGRSGLNMWINHKHDYITENVGKRIADIVKLPLENAEKFQLIYYDISQEYRNHYDSWEHNYSEKTLRCMKYGGARLITALCYLNDVEQGGGTHITKKNITIEPIKGRLLVFHNTYSNTNIRHELSEHAGLPVIKGEKYAFNLWFKECKHDLLYEKFNPNYYLPLKTKIEDKYEKINDFIILNHEKQFLLLEQGINDNDINTLLTNVSYNDDEKRRNGWIQLNKINECIDMIEKKIKISRNFFENINIVEYKPNHVHMNHFTAYDLNTPRGKQYTNKLGQRIYTITLFLSDNIEIEYPKINLNKIFSKNNILFYKNTHNNNRDSELERIIKNNTNEFKYIANIYIREKDKQGNILNINSFINNNNNKNNKNTNNNTKEIKNDKIYTENYTLTLEVVLDKFKHNLINKQWNKYESFTYNFKGDFDVFKNYILSYIKIKDKVSILNDENLKKTYSLNPELSLEIVNNVLTTEYLKLLQNYYKENIKNNTWVLGDRQSKRYKAHNEPFSRFLHYELLPLIEKITNKKLKPSYTYLSCYVKGADLPGHTDREDCEYTVSFVIDKPKDSNWNIYLHKIKQPIKYKGRYEENPPKEECIPVDCESGGLMIFQGTDHIHFRETLEFDYYNILLLHYCSI